MLREEFPYFVVVSGDRVRLQKMARALVLNYPLSFSCLAVEPPVRFYVCMLWGMGVVCEGSVRDCGRCAVMK